MALNIWSSLHRVRSMALTHECPKRARQCRSSTEPLCREQKGERIDGSFLLQSFPVAGHRSAVFYGLWALGPAGHGAVLVYKENSRRGAVFNFGKHQRDFTYVDDVVEGVIKTLDKVATPDPGWNGAAPDPATSAAPYRLYNI
jgi:hypothetical protein